MLFLDTAGSCGPCRHGLAWFADTLREEDVIPAGQAWLNAGHLDDMPLHQDSCCCAMQQSSQAGGCSESSAVLQGNAVQAGLVPGSAYPWR